MTQPIRTIIYPLLLCLVIPLFFIHGSSSNNNEEVEELLKTLKTNEFYEILDYKATENAISKMSDVNGTNRKGMTVLVALASLETKSAGILSILITSLGIRAKNNKQEVNLGPYNGKTLIEIIVLNKLYVHEKAIKRIDDINQMQSNNKYEIPTPLVTKDNIIELLTAIIDSNAAYYNPAYRDNQALSLVKFENKYTLIERVMALNPKLTIDLQKKNRKGVTLINYILNKRAFKSNEKAILLQKIYEKRGNTTLLSIDAKDIKEKLLNSFSLGSKRKKALGVLIGILPDPTYKIILRKVRDNKETIGIGILVVIVSTVIIYSVWRYKRRKMKTAI